MLSSTRTASWKQVSLFPYWIGKMFPIKVPVLLSVCNLHFCIVVLGTWGAFWRSYCYLLELKSSCCVSGCATWTNCMGSCLGSGRPSRKKNELALQCSVWKGRPLSHAQFFSFCGGCAAGKRLWHGDVESPGGPARVQDPLGTVWFVHSVQLPSTQPRCTVARNVMPVRPGFVHLSILCLDSACGSAEYTDWGFQTPR